MRMLIFLVPVIAAAAQADRTPASPQCAVSGASVEYKITGVGGGYEVTVNPKLVTLFHFPSKIAQSFLSNQRDFSINSMSRSVAIYPLKDNVTANLNVDTVDNLHVSVTIKTGPLDQAKAQVIFTSEQEEQRYEAEVDKRLLPLAQRQMARGILAGFHARNSDAIARTDDNVVVRVLRVIVIGDDTYVVVGIENRSGDTYRVSDVKAMQAQKQLPARIEFQPPGDGFLTAVTEGASGTGVIVVPTRELKAGVPVEIALVNGATSQTLFLKGVRAD